MLERDQVNSSEVEKYESMINQLKREKNSMSIEMQNSYKQNIQMYEGKCKELNEKENMMENIEREKKVVEENYRVLNSIIKRDCI